MIKPRIQKDARPVNGTGTGKLFDPALTGSNTPT
jgi:hypothetical protein